MLQLFMHKEKQDIGVVMKHEVVYDFESKSTSNKLQELLSVYSIAILKSSSRNISKMQS